jgi:oligopeptide/dipeptide ABC transporter ATP-binding protein
VSASERTVRGPRRAVAEPVDDGGLVVRGLRVSLGSGDRAVDLVDGVDLDLAPGRRLALVGESGSGKSLTATALMGLVDEPLRSTADVLRLGEVDLLRLSPAQWRGVRGARVAMVQQDPLTALSPVFSAGSQVAEATRARSRNRKEAWARAVDRMREVGIPDPAVRAHDFPHQLSGGLRQRVAIAMALGSEPRLMIADEPTTALDVTVQSQIIELLRTLSEQRGMSVVFITHDLGIVPGFAHELAVMYAGRIVESGMVGTVLRAPRHPYTSALIASQPGLDPTRPRRRLPTIPGSPPAAGSRPPGCAFAPRCPLAQEICIQAAPVLREVDGRVVACHRADEVPTLLGGGR